MPTEDERPAERGRDQGLSAIQTLCVLTIESPATSVATPEIRTNGPIAKKRPAVSRASWV